jgi:hypothetical protein
MRRETNMMLMMTKKILNDFIFMNYNIFYIPDR